ncbi:uncharacterized protein LOC135143424 [Zophobas morio]|uniref:uncharacterized protein LOC135143424 n=1 Tax=Zophobas morio TaxID=2755281 RepID=UPI0030830275
MKIFVDNQAAIKLSQAHQLHSRTKHMDVKVCFVRDECEKLSISINYVNTSDQLADFLTKPLLKHRTRNNQNNNSYWRDKRPVLNGTVPLLDHLSRCPHIMIWDAKLSRFLKPREKLKCWCVSGTSAQRNRNASSTDWRFPPARARAIGYLNNEQRRGGIHSAVICFTQQI